MRPQAHIHISHHMLFESFNCIYSKTIENIKINPGVGGNALQLQANTLQHRQFNYSLELQMSLIESVDSPLMDSAEHSCTMAKHAVLQSLTQRSKFGSHRCIVLFAMCWMCSELEVLNFAHNRNKTKLSHAHG
jgi:hypothetical protein